MIKPQYYLLLLFFFNATLLSAQKYSWTGNANNGDFFDENNWVDASTNLPPLAASIDAGTAINATLIVKNSLKAIQIDSPLSFASDSLILENCNVNAISISGGVVVFNQNSYLQLANAVPIINTKIIFNHPLSWLRTPKTTANELNTSFISSIFYKSAQAVYKQNMRLDNYYSVGAVVRPLDNNSTPLTIYNEPNFASDQVAVSLNTSHKGSLIPGAMDNSTSSFKLKKGYMATLANEANGTGLSKVYIASEKDLEIAQLPIGLDNAISFIRVTPWNWVCKKGTGGNITAVEPSWFYVWSSTSSSDINRDYAPMAWGASGANDDGDINNYLGKYGVTHVMGFNEADNCNDQSGQYNNLCDPATAVGYYKNLMKTGLRLLGPSGRENAWKSWLPDFYDIARRENVRIDAIGVHWYDWGSTPDKSPNEDPVKIFNRFKSYLTNVYNMYKMPIWITEFNANPNRTGEVNKGFMELALPYLESLDYVERYAWFQPSSNVADYLNSAGTLTEVGTFYKNQISTKTIADSTVIVNNNLDYKMAFENPFIYEYECELLNYTTNSGYVMEVLSNVKAALGQHVQFQNKAIDKEIVFKLPIAISGEQSISIQYLTYTTFGIFDCYIEKTAGNWSKIGSNINMYNSSGGPQIFNLDPIMLDPGNYNVKFVCVGKSANSSNYTGSFDKFIVNTKIKTSIEGDNLLQNTISIRPNPVSDILHIDGSQNSRQIAIFNSLGNEIHRTVYADKIDVSKLHPGIYFLKTDYHTVKFVKK